MNELVAQDDESGYLRAAATAWTDLSDTDIITPEGRIALGKHLMHHSFMQAMISLMKGNYYQVSAIVEELKVKSVWR